MPTLTAGSVIDDAQIVLMDTTAARWSDTGELLHWFNAGQREIATIRPDACTVTEAFSCAGGTRQTLPEGATALVEVVRNASGNAVRKTPRDLLDAHRPGWHNETAAATKHYMYDPRTPREFYVYPPAVNAASLTIRYQATPAAADTLADVFSVDDMYQPALLDYVLWRAYTKDSDDEANLQRAAAHRASFEKFMGLKAAADAAQVPKTDPEA